MASWFLGVFEFLLMWKFVPFAYQIGVPVLNEPVDLPLPAHAIDAAAETATGKFKLIDSHLCLFRPQFRFLTFDIQTPFPIKGVIRWEPEGARIVGRIPVRRRGVALERLGFCMGTFGLVHGGGLGAWCWERLLPELTARGRAAATVDLSPEDQSAGAARVADAVLQAFVGIDDLILVGHSIAGLAIPLVVTQRPVTRLVFMHALLPRPGESLLDQFKAEPDMFNPDMLTIQGPWWADEAIVSRFLFHDCPPEVAHGAFARLRPETQALTSEITPLKAWPNVPSSYIVCTEDRTATPVWARRAARERLGIEPIEIPSGHCPFLSCPKELANALEHAAGAPTRRLTSA